LGRAEGAGCVKCDERRRSCEHRCSCNYCENAAAASIECCNNTYMHNECCNNTYMHNEGARNKTVSTSTTTTACTCHCNRIVSAATTTAATTAATAPYLLLQLRLQHSIHSNLRIKPPIATLIPVSSVKHWHCLDRGLRRWYPLCTSAAKACREMYRG